MPEATFRFQQFSIRHDRCAMKVGTDGVLLGAWGDVSGNRILDIGTGSGLIALMAAQRNEQAFVDGIDIDEQAVAQARENALQSPFSQRIRCFCADVLTFRPDAPYNAILCNPPFFTEETLPPVYERALARNSHTLSFAQLVVRVASLLNDDGRFSTIVPSSHEQEFVALCLEEGLCLARRQQVRTVPHKPPRRSLLCFDRKCRTTCELDDLFLSTDGGGRSKQYSELTKDFYLHP